MAQADNPKAVAGDNSGTVDIASKRGRELVKGFVSRIEKLQDEKDTIGIDIKDVYAEAKGSGIDTKALRKVIARRKRDADELSEEDTMIQLFEEALGVFA